MLIAYQDVIKPRPLYSVAVLLIVLLGTRTGLRGLDWKDQYTISSADIVASEGHYIAYNNIAGELIQLGKYHDAKKYAQHSIAVFPTYRNYNNLGISLASVGDYAGASNAYTRGLGHGAYKPLCINGAVLSLVYGDPGPNRAFLALCLEQYPHDATLWQYLSIFEYKHGNHTGAKSAIANAARYGNAPQYEDITNDRPISIEVTIGGTVQKVNIQ
jgi:predicted Zn-dependent protease